MNSLIVVSSRCASRRPRTRSARPRALRHYDVRAHCLRTFFWHDRFERIPRRASSGAIPELLHAGDLGAMGAAEDAALLLHAVPDDAAAAMGAHRRKGLDGALEAVERVRGTSHRHLERLVVLVSAHLTGSWHLGPPSSAGGPRAR